MRAPLSADEFEMLGALMSRLGTTLLLPATEATS